MTSRSSGVWTALAFSVLLRSGHAQIQILERVTNPALPLISSDFYATGFSTAVLRLSDQSVLCACPQTGSLTLWSEAGALSRVSPPPGFTMGAFAMAMAPHSTSEVLVVYGNETAVFLRPDNSWNVNIPQPPALPPVNSLGWNLSRILYVRLVKDPSRGRVILFRSAAYGFTIANDFLEFDGAQWSAPTSIPISNPPEGQPYFNQTRASIQCVDSRNNLLVEWSGSTWVPMSPFMPFSQWTVSGATDDGHGHVIVCGSVYVSQTQRLHKTLSWNGVSWADLTTTTEPVPETRGISHVFLLRDPSHDEVLEIGETGIWAWNGTSWRSRNTAVTRPSPRNDAMLAEYVGNGAVLFGGRDATNQPNDETWLWDSTKWKRLSLAVRPPARSAAAMVRGPNGIVVLFGGANAANTPLADTWVLDPANGWRNVSTNGAPARLNHAMAFAIGAGPAQRVYLFGGTTGTTWFGDLRFFDTSTGQWVLSTSSGPAPRDIHAMCVDERRKQIVLFGGRGSNSATLGDTWEFDLNAQTWSLRSPVHAPTPRMNHAMVYDRTRDRVVLLGGYEPGTGRNLDDVWEYDGLDWTRRTTSTLPMAPTENPAACFDGRTQRIVVFGGWTNGAPSDKTYELVEWNGPGTLRNDARLALEVLGAPTVYAPYTSTPLDVRFPNPGGAATLLVGFGPTPSPSFVGAPPLFCTSQTLYTPLQAIGSSAANPARFTVPFTGLLVDRLVSVQGYEYTSTGCIDATDARNIYFRSVR